MPFGNPTKNPNSVRYVLVANHTNGTGLLVGLQGTGFGVDEAEADAAIFAARDALQGAGFSIGDFVKAYTTEEAGT